MKTIELFAGTGSFSKVIHGYGFSTFQTDYEEIDGQDLVADIRTLTIKDFPYIPDILWASPPCEGFSVASIGRNWGGGYRGYDPKSDSARRSIELVQHAVRLIEELKPTWWFIENPRGVLRKLDLIPKDAIRHTVTYCQYGDTRMKPTDIWTNAEWWTPRPMCKNGDTCHVSAPRGSKTGTQGIKGYKDRSRIPRELFMEIIESYPHPPSPTKE
jgi:hypothetical protein